MFPASYRWPIVNWVIRCYLCICLINQTRNTSPRCLQYLSLNKTELRFIWKKSNTLWNIMIRYHIMTIFRYIRLIRSLLNRSKLFKLHHWLSGPLIFRVVHFSSITYFSFIILFIYWVMMSLILIDSALNRYRISLTTFETHRFLSNQTLHPILDVIPVIYQLWKSSFL